MIISTPSAQKERVVHRVVSTGPDGIRTQGDANPYRDAWGLRQKDRSSAVPCPWSAEAR